MLNEQQLKQVENSFKHSNVLVARIGEEVYVCERTLKHKKEGTIELRECYKVDETCFEENGEYYGETLNEEKNFIMEDYYANYDYAVASIYFEDEIKETW